MVTTGFTLAILTATGFLLIYRKLPARIQRFMKKHVLLTDAIACLLTYSLFTGTVVGLFAAAFVGVITTMMLALVNNPRSAMLLERFSAIVVRTKDKFVDWVVSVSPELPTDNCSAKCRKD